MATNNTNSKKTNTNTGNTKNSRKNSTRKTTRTNTTAKRSTASKNEPIVDESIKEEVSLLLILAFSIILLISNFGMAGFLGEFVSKIGFGMMGAMNYIFPIFILGIVAYIYIHRKNTYIYIKIVAAVILFNSLCSLLQIMMEPVDKQAKLLSYYVISSEERTGGGLVSGFTVKILCPFIGVVGTVILLIVLCIAACVVLSEKSFIQGIKNHGKRAKEDINQLKFRRQGLEDEYGYDEPYFEEDRSEKVNKRGRRSRNNQVVKGVSFDTTLQKQDGSHTLLGDNALSYEEQIAMQDEPYATNPKDTTYMAKDVTTPALFDTEVENSATTSDESNEGKKGKKHRESQEEINKVTTSIEQDIEQSTEKEEHYVFPSLDLLSKGRSVSVNGEREMRETAIKLQQTLQSFGVSVVESHIA